MFGVSLTPFWKITGSWILGLLLWSCLSHPCLAQEVFVIQQFNYLENLETHTRMLVSDQQEAAAVLKLPDEQWLPVFKQTSLRSTPSSVWFKTSIRNDLKVPVKTVLLLKTSLYDEIHFFVLQDGLLVEQQSKTGQTASLLRGMSDLRPALTLNLEPGGTRQILISLLTVAPQDVALELSDDESYSIQFFYELLRQLFLLILLLILALVALAQGLVQKRSIPLVSSACIGLGLLYLIRLLNWPLLEMFWEPLGPIFPPLNHLLCGELACLILLLRKLSYGIEPKGKLQKMHWVFLGFFALNLGLVAVTHQDQSFVIMLPSQLLMLIFLGAMDRLAHQQNHPRRVFIRVLLIQQLLLFSVNALILMEILPLWVLPESSLWIHLICSLIILYLVIPSYRPSITHPHMTSPTTVDTAMLPKPEAKTNLLHEQWLHAEKMAALGTFTNGLANELNNPLAIIAGHRFRLSSMIDSRSFNIHEFEKSLGKVDQAVNRMIAVIDALKVYSQDPQGQEIFKTFSLRETIKYTIDLCRDKVVSRGIKLSTPELGDATMEGHQGQIIQVLLILVDNAIDALETVTEKSIRVELQPLPDTIRIAVIDSGEGVALGLRGKIWDPFFTSKDPFRHKGLGLSIASGIISNHRGRILLDESTPETRFVVELPRTRRPLGLATDFTADSR